MNPDPAELGKLTDAGRIAGFLPYLKNEFSRLEDALDARMALSLRDSALTPEVAQQGWLERLTLQRVIRSLEQRVRMGTSVNVNKELDIFP